MEYPNLYKRQKIVALEFPKMRLEDGFEWYIVKDASLPSQEALSVGDDVDIEPMGATRPGEEIKSYKVIKDPKKQGFKVLWLNPPDKEIKKSTEYDIEKKRKGTLSDGYASETKLGENYPDEWLNRDWKIKEVSGEGHVSVADSSPNGSKWELLQFSVGNFRGWEAGQAVRISKRKSGMTMYWIENLDIPDSQPVGVHFMGWAKSKF